MRESRRTLWPYMWRYRRPLSRGFTALVLKDAAAALTPLLIREGVDALTQGFRLERLVWFSVALAVLSAIKGLFQYWMRVILIGVSRDVEYDLRNDLFTHLIGLSRDFYSRFRTGDIMARATNDLNAVRMMAGPGIMYWSETSLLFVLAIAAMLTVDWPLKLMALAPAPLVSVAVVFFGRIIHDRFQRIQKMFSDISSRVQENLAGARVVRAYVQEEAELKRFELLNRDYIEQNIRLARASGMFMPMLQSLIGVTFLVVLWGGGARLLQGKITLGTFLMFNTYMGLLIWPMIAFGWVVNLMQRGSASLKRINEILQEKPSIAVPANARRLPQPVRVAIEFRVV